MSTTTTKPSSTKSSSSTISAPSGSSTVNCGPQYGNDVCASGLCCSQYGWCANDAAHCGTGCQPGFGVCGIQSSFPSSSPSTSSSTSSTFIGSPTGSTLNCGPAYGNRVCLSGLCCSSAGWCNNDPDHCGAGCQPSFGACGTLTAHPAGPTGSTTKCGPANNYAVCARGLCCSISGNCGTGEDFCSDPFNCQFGYGDCDSSKTPAGTSTINDPRPLLGSVSYTQDIYDCTAPNVIALTYDDGPLDYTGHLLDVLKQYGFHATFFVSGNNIAKGEIDTTAPWPTYIKRMIAEGHQVASHTWSHYDLGGLSSADRIQQMVKNERALANIIGKYPTYMRPPFSSCSGDCQTDMQDLGYHRVYFDLDSQDYLNDATMLIQNSKDIVRWALGNETNGENQLVLQHDIHYQTAYNLSSFYFDLIKAKGWKGVSVGECLLDPKSNWYRVPGSGQGTA